MRCPRCGSAYGLFDDGVPVEAPDRCTHCGYCLTCD
jgi:hypothetical protein